MAKTIGITGPKGFRAAGGTYGIKPSGLPDMTLIVADAPCAAAAVFTRNRMPGAPVIVGKRHVRGGTLQAIVVNAGVSNVCTGEAGIRDAEEMCQLVAEGVGCAAKDVLPASTGVIGQPLPMDKIRAGIADLSTRLKRGPKADAAAAKSILTTDLVAKTASKTLTLGGKRVTIAGIAKGSGMIAPNMATMLSYITTDAAISPAALKAALKAAVAASYNRISVDADTSTSDMVAVLASGAAGNRAINQPKGKNFAAFAAALLEVSKDLAYQIIKDGEGAEKVYRVVVRGCRTERDADRIGRTVVDSPLVKTAVHGGDPNWGRLIMAVGRSGVALKPERLDIAIAGTTVCKGGERAKLTPAAQKKLDKAMAAKEITFTFDLGLGKAEAEWLGCDLSREYITINADYTT